MKFLCLLIFHLSTSAFGQAVPEAHCSSKQSGQFDFWVGDWTLSWEDTSGNRSEGRNLIRRILGTCVIEENFADPSTGFEGTSLSVYNIREKQWKQTWVDNRGSYLDFSGRFDGEKMVLSREAVLKNPAVIQRMVWYNIAENTLDWNWERSDDAGESWTVLWKIHYERRRPSSSGG